ncbi:hypothetical protein BP6252_12099 [Coleophoma cylindrospora]|uniref:Glutamine synthetase n=1 Tax=Coleophoma cylindrospora TaxID=1849047 RepID=A0A3D8QFT6_9HELO|nr:hypothetical protein BP6252_12099 [Coleophoma cylindrospora]
MPPALPRPVPVPTGREALDEISHLEVLLAGDNKVKVAGVDADGLLRGKIISKAKFLAVATAGFGMSSALFGWDMHDVIHTTSTTYNAKEGGFADFIATPDLRSFRRIPWENNIPFFLLHFSMGGKPVMPCSRSILKAKCNELRQHGYQAKAGVELEFVNYQTPSEDGYAAGSQSQPRNLAAFLNKSPPHQLRPLSDGMFGYSLTRISAAKEYFMHIFDASEAFDCSIESWHTESGPGVFEAALTVSNIDDMADKVSLFKYLAKSLGQEHGATPCFMAKPTFGLPGNSGHIHLSLVDSETGKNAFARDKIDPNAPWSDIAWLSDTGRYFLAGVLDALQDIMPLLAPTVNSYKRLVENYWAPVHLSWGLEDRLASVRLITPPTCMAKATRFEVRIPGADLHPHHALGALMAAGLRGVQKKLRLALPPLSARPANAPLPEVLPNSLEAAVSRFVAPDSIARELFGDEFVDYYAATREHELRCWREAVTDWEFKRYIETV